MKSSNCKRVTQFQMPKEYLYFHCQKDGFTLDAKIVALLPMPKGGTNCQIITVIKNESYLGTDLKRMHSLTSYTCPRLTKFGIFWFF